MWQKKAHEMLYKAGHFRASDMVKAPIQIGGLFYGCYEDWKVGTRGRWVLYGDGSGGDSVVALMGSGAINSDDSGLHEFSEVGKNGAQYP